MAVTNGHISSPRFPYVPSHIHVRGQSADVDALLDTGFDGDVAVPADFVAGVGPPDGISRWVLADGSPVHVPYYIGTVQLDGLGPFPALVIVLGDEPLVGAGACRHVTLVLDHARRVVVQPSGCSPDLLFDLRERYGAQPSTSNRASTTIRPSA